LKSLLNSYPFYKMDLKNWMEQEKIEKYEKIRKNVYCLFSNDSSKYFLKRIQSIREFKIMQQLSFLEMQTFQKGILLKSNYSFKNYFHQDINKCYKDYLYILTHEIQGEDLYSNLNLPIESFKNILDTIIFSLRCAWEKIGFVHMDLHLGNIFIQKIQEPLYLETIWKSDPIHPILDIPNKIQVENYLPLIIDFDMSITKRYCYSSQIQTNILRDIWHILGILSLYMNQEKGILVLDYLEKFLDRNEFQEKKEQFANEWFNIVPPHQATPHQVPLRQ